jgi:phosphoadenosine phosphosulfate reductase
MKDLVLIKDLIKDLAPVDSLKAIASLFPNEAVYSTSFSHEAQAITHIIFSNDIPIEVFTLDTGRFFAETYSVWSSTLDRYKKPIKAYYPNAKKVEDLVSKKGPNSFYASVDNRKECCHIRKVEPLKRALKGKRIWVTGIRSENSEQRSDLPNLEWDEVNQVVKYHPLLHWTHDEVLNFIRENNIPYNPLHDKGYVSIGCAPCTRAVKPGEDSRAGRWWWEDNSKKECGLHYNFKSLNN